MTASLETVAGLACVKWCVSKIKLTLDPNWIRSPFGSVRSLLSSRTELRDSIHLGSMSPSQMIQQRVSLSSLTTFLELAVITPFLNSRVSWSYSPRSMFLLIALGFKGNILILRPIFSSASLHKDQMVLLPDPEGPTSVTPILWLKDS